ncbi:MAG: hypothetical protein HS111_13630 [Kofleriaceae bacterium]|nr:hypothetical protein [Kofleriaceae bacterium]
MPLEMRLHPSVIWPSWALTVMRSGTAGARMSTGDTSTTVSGVRVVPPSLLV